jgi:hypothetical protein
VSECIVCRHGLNGAHLDLPEGQCADPWCVNYCRPETQAVDRERAEAQLSAFWRATDAGEKWRNPEDNQREAALDARWWRR